jgi:hypothetical protein
MIKNLPYFNRIQLTEESIQKTRKWFADNCIACIEEVKSGKTHVNDPESYFADKIEDAKEYMNGSYDHVIAFLQRAYYIQTGESVALLP